jgi:hypothetical protein
MSAAENTLSATMLAHATFYDALPANVQGRAAIAPAVLRPQRAPRGRLLNRLWSVLDNWFYRQQLASREAYLAQATDIFDVERRIRQLERRPHGWDAA